MLETREDGHRHRCDSGAPPAASWRGARWGRRAAWLAACAVTAGVAAAGACSPDGHEPAPAALPVPEPAPPEGVPPPAIHAPPDQLEVDVLGPELDGPADVFDVSIDAGGGVWLAHRGGASVRPPREHFVRRVPPQGLEVSPVLSVGGAGPGEAIVGYRDAHVTRLTIQEDGFESRRLAPAGLVSAIRPAGGAPGRMLLAGSHGVIVLEPDGSASEPRTLPPPSSELWALAPLPGTGAWVGDAYRVARLSMAPRADGADPVVDLVPGEDDDVVAADACPDGSVWVATLGHGAFELAPDGAVRRRLTANDVLPQDHVTAIACDPDGSVWIGTSWGGLVRRRPEGGVSYHTRTAGLPGDSIRRLLLDRGPTGHRRLWLATEGGAASYDGP